MFERLSEFDSPCMRPNLVRGMRSLKVTLDRELAVNTALQQLWFVLRTSIRVAKNFPLTVA